MDYATALDLLYEARQRISELEARIKELEAQKDELLVRVLSALERRKRTTKYEVRSEGDLVEAEFTDRTEAEEFLKGLDDAVLPLELVEVVETVLETRNVR